MLTEISPGGWVDLDTICSICVDGDVVRIGLANTQELEVAPRDGFTVVTLANKIADLVNRLDEPDSPSQRQALS